MPPSDQEPRYQLVDSNGNVVGSFFGDGSGNVVIADETDTQTTFGPDGITTPALEAKSSIIDGTDIHTDLLVETDITAFDRDADDTTNLGLSLSQSFTGAEYYEIILVLGSVGAGNVYLRFDEDTDAQYNWRTIGSTINSDSSVNKIKLCTTDNRGGRLHLDVSVTDAGRRAVSLIQGHVPKSQSTDLIQQGANEKNQFIQSSIDIFADYKETGYAYAIKRGSDSLTI